MPPGIFDLIVEGAERESPLWASALRPQAEREPVAVFSPLCQERFAAGVETIYEGYLVHYGRPRLFSPEDEDVSLLLGDYLYAHGLVRIAETRDVPAVRDLAELISLCAQSQAGETNGDGEAWAATVALLGGDGLGASRASLRDGGDAGPLERAARDAVGDEAVERALAAHRGRMG
jgi:hypothetical protein